MYCYLVRHGKDNNSVRGGWSETPLTDEGIKQTEQLANYFADNVKVNKIYLSDLLRAKQTAEIIANKLHSEVEYISELREVNNGDLAGMNNDIAADKYPDFYWRKMDWTRNYPNGESPHEFYIRIKDAWEKLSLYIIANNENVILVTHGGVIEVIYSLINNIKYANKSKLVSVSCAEFIKLKYKNDTWEVV